MMEEFAIHNAEQYRHEYSRLALALEQPEIDPAPGEVEFLTWVTTPGCCDFGMLTGSEIFFAGAVSSILNADVAIEIGTASGFSAAVFAKIISLRQAASDRLSNGTFVHSIDKRSVCREDPSKPIGFAIEAMVPELRDRLSLHLEGDSSVCREILRAERMIGFVDGNHRHPWPLCDVLEICCLMKHGWILMHDIDLPDVIERALAAGERVDYEPVSGAKHVFESWPGKRIRSGNIGAIQIPDDRDSLQDFIDKMRSLPGEVTPGSWTRRWRTIDELLARPLLHRQSSWKNLIWCRRAESRSI
jgi:hypothetical protein